MMENLGEKADDGPEHPKKRIDINHLKNSPIPGRDGPGTPDCGLIVENDSLA